MAVEFYRYSYRTAEHDGDVEEYRASRDENRRCTEFIQHPQTGLYANAYKDSVLFYSLLSCLIVGVVLMIIKKKNMKLEIPFAPFMVAGAAFFDILSHLR